MRGLIVGKFYPLHMGHEFLIRTALEQVQELVVVLGDHPREQIPAMLRISWLKERFPGAWIERLVDEWGPDSAAWGRECRQRFGPFDLVFTSEDYGPEFADALGCRHVAVDPPRQTIPISGSAIRNDPFASWDFLPPPVKAYYARRIVLIGPKSSGKTTLAMRLANEYHTSWVPEFGRRYCEEFVARGERLEEHCWDSAEFLHIAERQHKEDLAARRTCNRLLFCDTDPFATAVWHERYLGRSHEKLLAFADPPALYLLCGADAPFVQDGLRDGELKREWMERRFGELLEERRWKTRILRGSWEERWEDARRAVEEVLR